ncbi:sensor histidine kinase [Adhaeribacter sp. BT258]|uniref:Sensor histidine kinase n=1 Tax=Adhaeribacter terrigena TaxID=2793070 RepID=A0ABS1BXM0_9BACT|nr:sensor histidine kinase [Adhaeribacter terrigena]MBK0401891.1 sensor histidine kinase [Adhaeribacter terrigena]
MQKKIFSYALHFILWFFFLCFPLIFFIEGDEFEIESVLTLPYYWLFSFSYLSLYYLNYYFFIPRFYLKKQYNKYILTIFGLFTAFYFLKPFILMFSHYLKEQNVALPDYPPLLPDTISIIIFVFVVVIGLAIQVIKQREATEKRALQAETDRANAELSYLKAQINPHFLFNTLNNIYSLSVDQHPETPASIMRLSNIMRYLTDDASKDFVPLEEEINCIRDYIDLQKLRLYKNMTVDFSVTGNIKDKQIAPLILMTYIENVFKYGISSREEARITIKLQIDDEKISFFCQNRIFALPRVIERIGIGLVNTEKRLKYLYPNKHNLTISNNNGYYTVNLTLFA